MMARVVPKDSVQPQACSPATIDTAAAVMATFSSSPVQPSSKPLQTSAPPLSPGHDRKALSRDDLPEASSTTITITNLPSSSSNSRAHSRIASAAAIQPRKELDGVPSREHLKPKLAQDHIATDSREKSSARLQSDTHLSPLGDSQQIVDRASHHEYPVTVRGSVEKGQESRTTSRLDNPSKGLGQSPLKETTKDVRSASRDWYHGVHDGDRHHRHRHSRRHRSVERDRERDRACTHDRHRSDHRGYHERDFEYHGYHRTTHHSRTDRESDKDHPHDRHHDHHQHHYSSHRRDSYDEHQSDRYHRHDRGHRDHGANHDPRGHSPRTHHGCRRSPIREEGNNGALRQSLTRGAERDHKRDQHTRYAAGSSSLAVSPKSAVHADNHSTASPANSLEQGNTLKVCHGMGYHNGIASSTLPSPPPLPLRSPFHSQIAQGTSGRVALPPPPYPYPSTALTPWQFVPQAVYPTSITLVPPSSLKMEMKQEWPHPNPEPHFHHNPVPAITSGSLQGYSSRAFEKDGRPFASMAQGPFPYPRHPPHPGSANPLFLKPFTGGQNALGGHRHSQLWRSPPIVYPDQNLYERVGQVGEGTFGKVYKARNKQTGEFFALKKIRMEAEKEGFPITAIREIKILQLLDHQHVVQFKELMVSKGSAFMVFEYMDHDLTGILTHPQGPIFNHPSHIKCLMKQLLEGLAYIHDKGVLHRDLKGSNLLMNARGELKLADFGLARLFEKKAMRPYTNRVVTLWYRCPELVLGATQYGAEVDLWSAGCIMTELFTRQALFQGHNEVMQMECIWDMLGTPREEDWLDSEALPWFEMLRPLWSKLRPSRFREALAQWMSPAGLDLVEAMLSQNPKRRPTAAQALLFPYFLEESPGPCLPEELPKVEGDWHEFESKQRKKEAEKVNSERKRRANVTKAKPNTRNEPRVASGLGTYWRQSRTGSPFPVVDRQSGGALRARSSDVKSITLANVKHLESAQQIQEDEQRRAGVQDNKRSFKESDSIVVGEEEEDFGEDVVLESGRGGSWRASGGIGEEFFDRVGKGEDGMDVEGSRTYEPVAKKVRVEKAGVISGESSSLSSPPSDFSVS